MIALHPLHLHQCSLGEDVCAKSMLCVGLVVRTQSRYWVGLGVHRGRGEQEPVPSKVPVCHSMCLGVPQGEFAWGEDVLWGVRFWAGAHEQPPAGSEQSAAVSLHSANKEASLSVHNVPSVLSAAQW